MSNLAPMSESQAKAVAASVGIDLTAINWRDALDKAILVLQWLRDLLGKQPVMATAAAAGAKAEQHFACCQCLESAQHSIAAASISLSCASDCCD